MTHHGACYRLGAPSWATSEAVPEEVDLLFTRDGVALLALTTHETLRPRSLELVCALRARGITPYILSGDRQARVDAVATEVGLNALAGSIAGAQHDELYWSTRTGSDQQPDVFGSVPEARRANS